MTTEGFYCTRVIGVLVETTDFITLAYSGNGIKFSHRSIGNCCEGHSAPYPGVGVTGA
jgi:hypothetical protein